MHDQSAVETFLGVKAMTLVIKTLKYRAFVIFEALGTKIMCRNSALRRSLVRFLVRPVAPDKGAGYWLVQMVVLLLLVPVCKTQIFFLKAIVLSSQHRYRLLLIEHFRLGGRNKMIE